MNLLPRLVVKDLLLECRPGDSFVLLDGNKEVIELDRMSVGTLLCFTGTLSVDLIQQDLETSGAPIPSGWVKTIAFAMEEKGIVEFCQKSRSPKLVKMLGPLVTCCEGCGRSCESHAIGPLSPERIKDIYRYHKKLISHEPSLAGIDNPVIEEKYERHTDFFLARINERCVYLKEDKKCLLHQHFGPEAKPAICRLWPLRVVDTEVEVRVAVGSGCYHQIDHFDDNRSSGASPVRVYQEWLTELTPLIRRLPLLPWRGGCSVHSDREMSWIRALILGELDPTELFLHMAKEKNMTCLGRLNKNSEKLSISVVSELMDKKIRDILKDSAFESVKTLFVNSETLYGRNAIELLRFWEGYRSPATRSLPLRAARFLRDELSRYLFLRDYMTLGDPLWAVFWVGCGARLSAARAESFAGSDIELSKEFGVSFSTWMRLMELKSFKQMLLTSVEPGESFFFRCS